jgi:hypothetical protein
MELGSIGMRFLQSSHGCSRVPLALGVYFLLNSWTWSFPWLGLLLFWALKLELVAAEWEGRSARFPAGLDGTGGDREGQGPGFLPLLLFFFDDDLSSPS